MSIHIHNSIYGKMSPWIRKRARGSLWEGLASKKGRRKYGNNITIPKIKEIIMKDLSSFKKNQTLISEKRRKNNKCNTLYPLVTYIFLLHRSRSNSAQTYNSQQQQHRVKGRLCSWKRKRTILWRHQYLNLEIKTRKK